uniref:At1g61320/AtMIF1 LRR domain-containing protein n=1 Tax=Oryza barthii TaxID=65489 RepID=A0A0D3FN72_9ORYZ
MVGPEATGSAPRGAWRLDTGCRPSLSVILSPIVTGPRQPRDGRVGLAHLAVSPKDPIPETDATETSSGARAPGVRAVRREPVLSTTSSSSSSSSPSPASRPCAISSLGAPDLPAWRDKNLFPWSIQKPCNYTICPMMFYAAYCHGYIQRVLADGLSFSQVAAAVEMLLSEIGLEKRHHVPAQEYKHETYKDQVCQESEQPTAASMFTSYPEKHTCHVDVDVDGWVRFCAASRARRIAFDFTPGAKNIFKGLPDDKYIFPLHVFSGPDSSPSHVRSLNLAYVCLNTTTTGFAGFANLKKLTLHKVLFLIMLPECTALEWLSIICCSYTELTLCKPLLRLRYLCLHYCNLEKIELEAPNLTSFDLINRPIPLALSESPKVMKFKLLHKSVRYGDNLDYICTELPAALPGVQKLSITSTLYIYDELKRFAKTSVRFINLRHLNLSVDGILRLAYLLEVAPVLEELELHINEERICHRIGMIKLRRVVMSGACHWQGLIELAHCILRCAIRLDCMIMDPMVRIKGLPVVDCIYG